MSAHSIWPPLAIKDFGTSRCGKGLETRGPCATCEQPEQDRRQHSPPAVALDAHNQRLAEAIQADGRIYLASALIGGEVWLRPCFVNFRTTDEDVLAILDVARELGARLTSGAA